MTTTRNRSRLRLLTRDDLDRWMEDIWTQAHEPGRRIDDPDIRRQLDALSEAERRMGAD